MRLMVVPDSIVPVLRHALDLGHQLLAALFPDRMLSLVAGEAVTRPVAVIRRTTRI